MYALQIDKFCREYRDGTFLFFQQKIGTVRQYIKLPKDYLKYQETEHRTKQILKHYLLENKKGLKKVCTYIFS